MLPSSQEPALPDAPAPDEAPPDELPPDQEPLGWRPRPVLAILALLVAAAMVAAALGGYSFVGPEAPTPNPERTPAPARADHGDAPAEVPAAIWRVTGAWVGRL